MPLYYPDKLTILLSPNSGRQMTQKNQKVAQSPHIMGRLKCVPGAPPFFTCAWDEAKNTQKTSKAG